MSRRRVSAAQLSRLESRGAEDEEQQMASTSSTCFSVSSGTQEELMTMLPAPLQPSMPSHHRSRHGPRQGSGPPPQPPPGHHHRRHPRPRRSRQSRSGNGSGAPCSLTARAELIFPVNQVERQLQEGHYARRLNVSASIFLAAVLQYLTLTMLEAANNEAHNRGERLITPPILDMAVYNHGLLSELLGSITISQVGPGCQ